MNQFTSVILIAINFCLVLGLDFSGENPDMTRYGSHYIFNFARPDRSTERYTRCAPCREDDRRGDLSNFVDPDYRGNGADNLGYDWSPQAWGGLAFPQKNKVQDKPNDSWSRERNGRQMHWDRDRDRDERNDRVGCERCGSDRNGDWTSNRGGRAPDRDGSSSYDRQRGDGSRSPTEETTVTSTPLIFRDDNRIAYVPSLEGEMYWDGKSGGGTRWDGFSNGVSWLQGRSRPWDRTDWNKEKKTANYVPISHGPGVDRNYAPHSFRPWDDTTKGASGWDKNGKGYYFANGYPGSDKNKGYASSWNYGNTWNGNDMKWNYGGKHWEDINRDDDRYHPNRSEDRRYNPGETNNLPFGHQYQDHQPPTGYPISNNEHRPARYPTRPGVYPINSDKDYSSSKRDPAKYPNSYKPLSPDRFEDRNPGSSISGWTRPGTIPKEPNYSRPDFYDKPGTTGKYPQPHQGYLPQDKYSPSNDYDRDRNRYDYNKPWGIEENGRPGYYRPRPDSGSNHPYGGNRHPGGISPSGSYPQNNQLPPKGYYQGFITEIGPGSRPPTGGEKYPIYEGDRNSYPPRDRDRYPANNDGHSNRYPTRDKDRYPSHDRDNYPTFSDRDRHPDRNDGRYPDRERYPDRNKDRYPDRDKNRYPDRDENRYPGYGIDRDKSRYPDRYPSGDKIRPDSNRYPSNPGSSDYDRGPNERPNTGSDDENSWNYGGNDHKDGIYRRAGGSYPPYRGGQYYTSSYLASASTPAGSQTGPDSKTPSVTKPDEVTQPTGGTE